METRKRNHIAFNTMNTTEHCTLKNIYHYSCILYDYDLVTAYTFFKASANKDI